MMDTLAPFLVLVQLAGALVRLPETAAVGSGGSRSCSFPAVYNFGDSNSDTGGASAALSEVTAPNGETFFGHPSGRSCDGRLIIDFIAETLKLPYLNPYLDSLGMNFRHGANFATGGSSIRPGGYSPFHLGIQIAQFLQFKARTTALYIQFQQKNQELINRLPRPREFSEALYTFDIGQNDLAYGFQHMTEKRVRASVPDILMQFSQAVHQLYEEGARFFWIHNTGPLGCLPYSVIYDPSKPTNLDESGCVAPQNEMAREFNKQLKDTVLRLRKQLPAAVFTYVDVYSAKYALVSEAKHLGFVDPTSFCCGSFYGYHINCGKRKVVNGTLYGSPCNDPSRHVSWDGIHYTEAANRWIANRILNGSYYDPPVPIEGACRARK
ncbi:GDSL esterase/lipase At3g27950 isoform X2 [Punica granatum]|uniref:GDSL esterase/lipase At3g27950 isoform X2 n=2 Tax=Punica granatum TaxID=22663 RepID=A0A6P8CNW1_PUNGR|nr:GDSL esterase/lipase At3g27950 isoform X2 [Punica granatum]